jgi:hypothetical protein
MRYIHSETTGEWRTAESAYFLPATGANVYAHAGGATLAIYLNFIIDFL